MDQVIAQARRDAIDAHNGHIVRCPYDPTAQPERFNAWTMAFNESLLRLEALHG